MIRIKRIYDEPSASDGTRVLVDRLWPRGVKKEHAALDLWLKEVAPSPELRVWFGHRPERFAEFKQRYLAELSDSSAVSVLSSLEHEHQTVTLLYAAKDPQINHAIVLKSFLERVSENHD